MQFRMEIDNPRKRCRAHDDDEEDHATKKTRSDTYASARDSASPSPSDSAASTPAAIDESHDPFFSRATAQSGSTIISGWNQARRNEDLRQSYPWLYSTRQS